MALYNNAASKASEWQWGSYGDNNKIMRIIYVYMYIYIYSASLSLSIWYTYIYILE